MLSESEPAPPSNLSQEIISTIIVSEKNGINGEVTIVPIPGQITNGDNHVNDLPKIEPERPRKSLWSVPEGSKGRKIWWAYTWPIKFVLTLIVPSPKTYRKLYPVTFIMCIICIGLNSYLCVWMLTVIGYTLNIPESVMGLTFLSIGGCLPEMFAALIMALKGNLEKIVIFINKQLIVIIFFRPRRFKLFKFIGNKLLVVFIFTRLTMVPTWCNQFRTRI